MNESPSDEASPPPEDDRPADPEDWSLKDWIAIELLPTLMGSGLVGAALFGTYALVAAWPFPYCNSEAILGGTYSGGAASSLRAAAILGAALWLGAGVAACRFRSRRTHLVWGFPVLYALGLILLGTVIAPLIWGPRVCG